MSAIESIELLREFKEKGADVSGEVTIHHLLLTEDDVTDTNSKMNPPLRTKRDRQALINELIDGAIESAITLFYTNFVKKGIISLEQFIEFTSLKPAKRFGIEGKGKIEEGYDADLVILSDENKENILELSERF